MPLLLLIALMTVQHTEASGTGVCGVQGKITKLKDKRGRQFSFLIAQVRTLEGDGACGNLMNTTMTVDMGPKSKRHFKGEFVKVKAHCYHNETPTSGVHDCYKWETMK